MAALGPRAQWRRVRALHHSSASVAVSQAIPSDDLRSHVLEVACDGVTWRTHLLSAASGTCAQVQGSAWNRHHIGNCRNRTAELHEATDPDLDGLGSAQGELCAEPWRGLGINSDPIRD